MAKFQSTRSDLTGTVGPEEEFATLIVRQHPKVQEAKRLDALPTELEQLKSVGDLVIVEVRLPDTTTKELHIKYADFSKVVPDEVVSKAPGTRGRIPGTRVGNGG